MARQYFNVNTQTKLIDTHNKFNGGLKTVDTDDALKDFFLRQAENVSISEFGFLEKRYGLSEKQKLISHGGSISLTDATRVQGHYKFKYGTSTDELLAVGGKLYLKEHNGSWAVVSSFTKDTANFSYPTDSTLDTSFTNGTFQSTRDVGMAKIKNNLFIFTGDYPLIYTRHNPATGAALSNGTVYVMPYFIPSWNEVAGANTGVNLLLGADYDAVYGYDDLSLISSTSTFRTTTKPLPIITNIISQHAPLIPTANYAAEDSSGNVIPQIRLEATLDLKAPAESFKTFENFDHTSDDVLVYQSETQQLGEYYLPYSGTITSGTTTCTVLGSRAVDDNTNYFVCVASTSNSDATKTNSYYQLIPRTIQYRESGAETWSDVPESQIQNRIVYSNANNASDFSDLYGSGLPFENEKGIYRRGYSNVQMTNAQSTATTISTPLQVGLKGFSVGTFDFKVIWHWERQYETSNNAGVVETFETIERQYTNIQVTPEKLEFASLGYEIDALISCNKVIERDGRLLAFGSTSMPEFMFFSSVEYYNWFPASFTLQLDTDENEVIQSIVPFMNVLIAQTEGKTFGIKGNTPQALSANVENVYQIFPINPVYGTIAPKSVRPVRNKLFFLSRQGIVELNSLYAVDNRYNVNEVDRNIKNVIPQDENAVAIQHDYQYWINFPSTGETFRYYVDKKAWVKDSYGTDSTGAYDFDGVSKYYVEDGVLTFISNVTELDSSPAVNSIYEIEIDKTLPSDFTKTIKSSFETAALNQGYPFHLKKYYENRMDFTLQNEYNSSKDPITFTITAEEAAYAQFNVTLLKNHQYQIGFGADYSITNIQYIIGGVTTDAPGFSYDNTTYIAKFNIPYVSTGTMAIKVIGTSIDLDNAELKDITYDHSLTFNTHSLGDQTTLNFDNLGYDITDTQVNINLGTVFGAGTWVFDESSFDDRIRAQRTVKLAGRGLNYKLFVTDRSKAKWTIENIGITFKFKRARKR